MAEDYNVYIDPYVMAENQMASMEALQNKNNAWSASQAEIQREWQEEQNAKAMAFNANEASMNREWQKMMSDTAHQREVLDLRAAGLNPILSATGGNGAAVGSGAMASGVTSAGAKGDTDTSVNGAVANLLGTVLSADYHLRSAEISAKSAESVAQIYTAMSKIVADIGLEGTKYSADKSYSATTWSAKYAADNSYAIARDFPNNAWNFLGTVLSLIFGRKGPGGLFDGLGEYDGGESASKPETWNDLGYW